MCFKSIQSVSKHHLLALKDNSKRVQTRNANFGVLENKDNDNLIAKICK